MAKSDIFPIMNTDLDYSLTFISCIILVKVTEDLEPILGTLGLNLEHYHRAPCPHTITHLFTLWGQFVSANLSTVFFSGKWVETYAYTGEHALKLTQ